MKPSILAAAALLALGIAAQPADARMLTGLNLTTHTLRADTVMTLDHADGIRHMRKFNDDPPDDPDPKKTPKKTPTSTTGTGSGSDTGSTGASPDYYQPRHPAGYWDQYGRWHRNPSGAPPAACSPKPC